MSETGEAAVTNGAAASQLESEADEHSRALDAAKAAHEAAIADVAGRHEAVQAINDQRDKALVELAQLDALGEINMEQLLVQVNLQKRVRTLEAQLGAAQDALTAAGEAQAEAERAHRRAQVICGDIRLQEMDRAYIDFVLDFAEKAAAHREAAFVLKRELETLETDLAAPEVQLNMGTPRGRFMLSVPESKPRQFLSNAVHDAHKMLVNLTEYAQRQDVEQQMETAATTRYLHVYLPPGNEQLRTNTPARENR